MGKQNKVILFFVLILAFLLRFYGIDWDKGGHLHPDERMIIMVSERLRLPTSASEILSCLNPKQSIVNSQLSTVNCSLNPQFFAYGSFPLYLLKTTGLLVSKITNDQTFSQYGGLLYLGRGLSVLFDLLTIILVYRICQLSFARRDLARLAAFLYAISVLSIQASHFYAVDIMLTTLSTLTLYRLLKLLEKPNKTNAALTGVAFGLALATKITIILLLVPILISLLFIYLKTKSFSKTLLLSFFLFTFSFFIFNLVMPYALIDFPEFKNQVLEQLKMNSNPYIFPFTLQYIGTLPYLYYLKNIFFWGLGIPYSLVAFISVFIITITSAVQISQKRLQKSSSLIILLIFFWFYFFVVGKSAVKFMRYLLPLYPLFAIFTAYFLYLVFLRIKKNHPRFSLFTFYFLLFTLFVWPLSFLHIYQQTHTRLAATYWINRNIPDQAKLAVEHWDDRLPLLGGEKYEFIEFPLYERDDFFKWQSLSTKISQADYLILASNRLYIPLPKLTDCAIHKNYCYPYTANYYQNLFAQRLGFKLEAVFTSYPTIPFLNLQIVDDSADESFTVYDHPKILIFKNEARFTEDELFKLITNH